MRIQRYAAAVCLFATGLVAAGNPFLGTWKFNSAKSKFRAGQAPKDLVVTFEADGDKVRRIAKGTDAEGKPIMQGGPAGDSIPWDGKDQAIDVPEGPKMTVAVKRLNDHTNSVTVKRDGKVVMTIRSVVSKDGRTMTNTAKGQDEKGQPFEAVEVMDRQ
jgi:hypothetical protein